MGLLSSFAAGMIDSASSRWEKEAEDARARKLAEFQAGMRRETNRMDAEMRHGYRMDEQAQSHKNAMGRVMAQDVINDRNTKEEREYQAELVDAANKRKAQQSLVEFQRRIAEKGVGARMRRETNEVDAEMRNKFAMDRQAQSNADAIARQEQQNIYQKGRYETKLADTQEAARLRAEQEKEAARLKAEQDNNRVSRVDKNARAREDIAQQNRIALEAQKAARKAEQAELMIRKRGGILDSAARGMTPYETESLTDDDSDIYDPEFGLMAANNIDPATIGSKAEGTERNIIAKGLLQEFGAGEAKKYLDATETTTTGMSDAVKTVMAMGYKPGTPEFEEMVLRIKGKGGGAGTGWDQKSASKFFTSQAWKAVGKGVDEYGIPIGEITNEDKQRVRELSARALDTYISTGGRTDPVAIIAEQYGMPGPVQEDVPSDSPEQRYIDEAISILNRKERDSGILGSVSNFFDSYDEDGDAGERADVMRLAWELQDRAKGGATTSAPTPTPTGAGASDENIQQAREALQQAREAIAKGADPERVKERLREMGYSPDLL